MSHGIQHSWQEHFNCTGQLEQIPNVEVRVKNLHYELELETLRGLL